MPSTTNGTFYRYAPGVAEDWSLTAQTATLNYSCPWPDRFVLRRELLGYSFLDATTNVLHRYLPATHPEAPQLSCTAVRLVETKGVLQEEEVTANPTYRYWDENGKLGRDGLAWLQATFQSTLYDVLADDQVGTGSLNGEWTRFTIRRKRGTVEAQRTPGKGWRWAGTGPPNAPPNDKNTYLQVDQSLPYQLTNVEWLWLALPALPPNRDNITNRVNSVAFQEFTAGTLLFGPCYEEPVLLPNLERGWNITFSAVHRPNTWNKVWRLEDPVSTGGAGFYAVEAVKADAGGVHRPLYLGYDFSQCWSFVPDAAFVPGY